MNDRSRFERLEAAWNRIVDLEGATRESVLAKLAKSDPEVHATLLRLLARDEKTDEARLGPLAEINLPFQLGPYILESRLGVGGMGEVFAARQEEPIRRRVAVKLVRPGLGSAGVLSRFDSEHQTLARMSHPGIAQVYDAGTTADGRPFFVMELVEGEPVTAWCDRRQLGVGARLELFLEICNAVHHAHQKGILHRDLKPSNILVAERDGLPMVKVIDFGIAKALETGQAEPPLTRFGEIVGSLEYMSPEQASGAATEADTRSDVYSLGAMLYQLLVGAVPLPVEDFGDAAFDEVIRRIREQDPPCPSARLAVQADRAATDRGTEPSTLRRYLRGDLDWIVMKAIDKQPDRRYPSASEFAADIRRHLADEPVIAGPPSRRYRLGKMVRRHRLAVAAATAILVALVAGVIGTSMALVRAQRAERSARFEAATAERVSDFLSELFRGSQPGTPGDREATALDLLERGIERVRTELADEPALRGRLLATLGDVELQLGELDAAAELLEEARSVLGAAVGQTDPVIVGALAPLARVRAMQQRFDDAEALYTEAIAIVEAAGYDERHRLVGLLNNFANFLLTTGRTEEAVPLAERGLEICRGVHGPDDRREASLLITIGFARDELGEYEQALTAYREALAIIEATLGPDHLQVGIILNNMGTTLARLGRLAEASSCVERSLVITQAVYGREHPRVADRLINLALGDPAFGLNEQARDRAQRALEIVVATLGPNHRRVPLALVARGTAELRMGLYDASLATLEEAIRRSSGQPTTFEGMLELWAGRVWAAAMRLGGDPEKAAARCRAWLIREETGRHPSEAGGIEAQLALSMAQLGDGEAARRTMARAVETLERAGVGASDIAMYQARLACRLGDLESCLEHVTVSVDGGLSDLRLATDPDLESVRGDARFDELVERVRARLRGPGEG